MNLLALATARHVAEHRRDKGPLDGTSLLGSPSRETDRTMDLEGIDIGILFRTWATRNPCLAIMHLPKGVSSASPCDDRMILRPGTPLSANMDETVTPLKFSVEGEAGLESDERSGTDPRVGG